MTKQEHTHNAPTTQPQRGPKRRITPRIREAVEIHIREGLPWRQSAERAGMSEQGLYMARRKPHVQAFIEERKQAFIAEAEAMRAPAKAQAIEIGRELMRSAKSEAVRARMVEFFAGEPKAGTQVNVQINNHAGEYEYVRPGAQVVEVRSADLTQASESSGEGESQ